MSSEATNLELLGKEETKKAAKEAKEAEKKAAKEAKEAEKKAAKEAKEAEKKAAKEAKEAEKKAAKEAKEAEKKAAKEAKEAEKKGAKDATDAMNNLYDTILGKLDYMNLSDNKIKGVCDAIHAKLIANNGAIDVIGTKEAFLKEFKKRLNQKRIEAQEEAKKLEYSQAKPTYLEHFDEIFEMYDNRHKDSDFFNPDRQILFLSRWDPETNVRDMSVLKLGKASDLKEDPVKLNEYMIRLKKINEVLKKVIRDDQRKWENVYTREENKIHLKPKTIKEFKQLLEKRKELSNMMDAEHKEGQEILKSIKSKSKSKSKSRSKSDSRSGGRRRTMKNY